MSRERQEVIDGVKQVMREINNAPLFQAIQKVTDTIYETAPFTFSALMKLYAVEIGIVRMVFVAYGNIAERLKRAKVGFDFAEGLRYIDDSLRACEEAREIWKRTRDMSAVRDFYTEHAAQRAADLIFGQVPKKS